MLAKSKLNSIEILVSQALNNQKLLKICILYLFKDLYSCVCIKWTHLLYSLQTHGDKTMLKL